MKQFGLVIVGGGLAGARAVRSYRAAGGDRTIALLSSDAVLPYHRPPLSGRLKRAGGEVTITVRLPDGDRVKTLGRNVEILAD